MIRGVGLRSATAINVLAMVGAGPFITLPLVVAALNGSVSAVAWIAGALIALCDGLVWAELASRYPRSGGSYAYLREALGATGPGRLVAFVFVWQYLAWAPLIIASGYLGFAQYAAYLVPALAAPVPMHAVAIAAGIVTLAALMRAIPRIAGTAVVLGAVALATLAAVIVAGFAHPRAPLAEILPGTFALGFALPALGAALVITLYDYSGYADVCALGDEVITPRRTIPLAIVLSVALVGAGYLLLNLGVAVSLAPREIAASTTVASLVAERAFGTPFAILVTIAVLITAFGSTFALLLAASRVPYAAAREGDFFPAFAALHPQRAYPTLALLLIGLLALPASLLSLDAVIRALTAGIVLVQGVGQIVALAVARRREPDAPFRVPLYPLPPLAALAGWIVLFVSTGPAAIAFGLATVAAGTIAYLVRARRGRLWPFALTAAALLTVFVLPLPAAAQTPPSWGHAQLVQRAGAPQLLVDGKPFFFFGGAFFYERLPPNRWEPSIRAMRQLGANTLDLYVPWNWHELADGDLDFTGRTDPRRNLHEVLRLARQFNMHLIVRPGPVIRNEWRNGGYPAWLLARPEYAMPLHEVLEGRYPATATLQNQHSDDAAAEWLRNETHLRYASRWLHAALAEFAPVADLVIAVQLDDDQAAYADNQTAPAPNLQRYLRWLDAQVRETIGPVTPTFINTYQMRVPALAPVWTMGNWYQSDAETIAEHDRAQLDFSTLLLATNPRGPAAVSEFQAGWFAGPEDPQPRRSDPSNTRLALFEMLALGVHGVVDFPLQDTHAVAGWEAPFAQAAYRWNAALGIDLTRGDRWAPTYAFGTTVARLGPLLASARRIADTAVLTVDAPGAASAALEAIAACGRTGRTCDLLDVAHPPADLSGYTVVVVSPALAAAAPDALAALRARLPRTARSVALPPPGSGVTTLNSPAGTVRIAVNWGDAPRAYDLGEGHRTVVPARDAALRAQFTRGASVLLPGPDPSPLPSASVASTPPCGGAADGAIARTDPHPGDDHPELLVLENDRLRVEIDPAAGARAFTIVACDVERKGATESRNATDDTGAWRDDVAVPLAPSPRDYIARFTHAYPAGTFNRAYRVDVLEESGAQARVRLTYTMPDAGPAATFERVIALPERSSRVIVDERLTGVTGPRGAVVRGSFPLLRTQFDGPLTAAAGAVISAPQDGYAFAVAWRPADIAALAWTPYRSTGTLALTLQPGWRRVVYAFAPAADADEARRIREAERRWAAANPASQR